VSASKDGFGLRSRGGWVRATRAHRCPVCGSDSWCATQRDGSVAICMRDSSGYHRVDAAGVDYWIHVLDESAPRTQREDGPDKGAAPRVDADALDDAYRAILSRLTLSSGHRESLERRGLPPHEIALRGYRTLPLEGRSAIAREVVARIGETVARGVPGLYVGGDEARTWWTLAGSPGLLIPVRDTEGRIVALKVRRDDAGDGPRYLYVSSASKGGPSACLAVHVPILSDSADLDEIRITEGELKADVASVLSDVPTISIPGVGSWRAAVPAVKALGAKRVRIALDVDHRSKSEVGIALALLVRACVNAELHVAVECWNESDGKGIDDVLSNGCIGNVRVVAPASGYAERVAHAAANHREARMVA
jgi:hypothetical protein